MLWGCSAAAHLPLVELEAPSEPGASAAAGDAAGDALEVVRLMVPLPKECTGGWAPPALGSMRSLKEFCTGFMKFAGPGGAVALLQHTVQVSCDSG